MKRIIRFFLTICVVFGVADLLALSKIPVVRDIVSVLNRNEILCSRVKQAKTNLVNSFICTVVEPKIKSVEDKLGQGSTMAWIDGSSHKVDSLLELAKTDPTKAFEKAQYALKRAYVVDLTIAGEATVRNAELEKKGSSVVLIANLREKYTPKAEKLIGPVTARYKMSLMEISAVKDLVWLENLCRPNGEKVLSSPKAVVQRR